jgi:hypothetical protein
MLTFRAVSLSGMRALPSALHHRQLLLQTLRTFQGSIFNFDQRNAEVPYASLGALDILQQSLRIRKEVLHDRDFELRVAGHGCWEIAPRERNDGCDGYVLEALLKDFASDEAG